MSPLVNSSVPDRLKDYTDVKERIRLFYETHPDGRLVTAQVKVTTKPDGVPRVWVHALAFRTPEDPLPGEGWSWMALPGKTPYTSGSEIENTETSAWGRAIGSLGIGISRSIASVDEIEAKDGQGDAAPAQRRLKVERGDDGALIGAGELSNRFPDFLPRQGPDGPILEFKLTSDAGGILVQARGLLGEVLPNLRDEIIGKRVSCWGRIRDETFTPKNAKRPITYQVLELERIRTESGTLPALLTTPEPPSAAPEPAGAT